MGGKTKNSTHRPRVVSMGGFERVCMKAGAAEPLSSSSMLRSAFREEARQLGAFPPTQRWLCSGRGFCVSIKRFGKQTVKA